MNDNLSEDIIDCFKKKSFLKEWLEYKYKEKSLALYGLPGTGKSTIADYILKDWVRVYIKSDFCKSTHSFEEYLECENVGELVDAVLMASKKEVKD